MEIRGKNEYEHLILKYDSNRHEYVDITKDIFFLKDDYNSWYVGFSYNSKYYHISYNELIVSTNPIKLEIDRSNIYINNKKSYDVFNIVKFDKLGYKVFLKDYKTIFVKNINIDNGRIDINYIDLNIKRTGNDVFDYYKTLAKYASELSTDDMSIESLLYKLYLKIDSINEDCVLEAYTKQNYRLSGNKIRNYIYPFSTNQSQIRAIEQTFNNKLSVIAGPPGTGKTQVILNLITNAVINNMSVAVISNNNTAVENVFDKMKEEGLEYLLAYLGNSENVDNFFSIADNLEERISQLQHKSNSTNVSGLIADLKDLYEAKNNEIKLKQELYELEQEYSHFKSQYEIIDYSDIIKEYSDYNKYFELKYYLLSLKKTGFIQKFVLKHKYKIDANRIDSLDSFILYLDYKSYDCKINNLNNKLAELKDFISKHNFDELIKVLKTESNVLLSNYLFDKYKNKHNSSFNKNNYKELFAEFINRYPVVLSTTHSLLRNIPYGYKFDLVIIDEASQSDILTSILTMNVAKQMVIVGDDKQLSQIDNQEIYDVSIEIANKFNIKDCYRYKDNSILQSVLSLPNKVERTILREHYRCDSRIIEFCNKKFYDGELIVCTSTSDDDPLFVVHTAEGNHARKNPNGSGQYNDREAQEIIEIIKNCNSNDIGIITPFRAQADYINKLIKRDFPTVEVDTIHKYQGRQKQIIILSTVVNDLNVEEDNFITDFVTNSKLLNVAISRAVKKLYLVVSDKVYNSSSNTISQFIDYIKYYCKDESIKEGSIMSIFDELYKDQNEALMKSKCSKYVDSYAEEIMLKHLNEVLDNYPDYKVVLHYRLSDLIKTYSGFNGEEIRYIKHPKTHVDFVIFDKITFKPVLCIEVDGTKYHDYDKVQVKHDLIKTRILEANNINIIRLKTNQSGEIEKIKKYL